MTTGTPADARGIARMQHLRRRQLLGDVAMATAALGFFVIPLWPDSKVPAMHRKTRCPGNGDCERGHRGWEERATRDPDTIARWWKGMPLNVGIATGRSGLHVLDLDAAHGTQPPVQWAGCRDGRDVLARLADRAGAPFPGDTRTVRTPTGGCHLYFQAPSLIALRNTVARVGWRVDSRGDGGFVVAAGSERPEGRYELVVDSPVAPMPAWLIPHLRCPVFLPPSLDPLDAPAVSEARRHAYLAAIEGSVGAAEPGTRHDVLLRGAYTLGRLVQGGDYSDDEAYDCLRNATAQWPGSPSRKDLRTIYDGLSAGKCRPRRLGK
jgi:hypothetical protein